MNVSLSAFVRSASMAPEQLVIGLLPFPLIVAAEHHRHDLSLFEHLADFGRIGRDIRPGRQAPLMRHERLAFLAQDEVAGKSRCIGVRRQRITPTEPKISGTGSISQKSVGAPDIFTLSVSGR